MNKKKLIKIIGAVIIFAMTNLLFTPRCTSIQSKKMELLYLKNNSLKIIKDGYMGNPMIDDQFINETKREKLSFFTVLKWRFSSNPQAQEKKKDPFKINVIKNKNIFDLKEDAIVWLSHASFLIRIDGKNILIDPCLTKPIFVTKLVDIPCEIEDIKNIDYLLISHNHRDHLDHDTIKRLNLKNTTALIPLRMGKIIQSMNKDVQIQEAGWYQKYSLPDKHPEIYFLPSQHWSKRGLNDTNKTLWGCYIIKGKRKTIYFAGDSSYAPHFKTISKFFPKIDICLMPIAAYKPDYIMKLSHMTPWEAVNAFNDLKAKILIPMHYGTFDLSDEPPGEPVRIIEELNSQKKINGKLQMLDIGQVYKL